jgi:hypothetical protein
MAQQSYARPTQHEIHKEVARFIQLRWFAYPKNTTRKQPLETRSRPVGPDDAA